MHSVAENHAGEGILDYAMVFFAIWWAWMNFTWFASAYDNDDVPYRIVTLVQIAGVLVLAAGVSRAFEDHDWTAVVIGYVIMRVAMSTQWLRAARSATRGVVPHRCCPPSTGAVRPRRQGAWTRLTA
ncbi:low temperature requirement protein LtrA [Streptomyces sp. DSM 42143]|nr:low temperature requirement protein LtrA [Streptomyces sp. DSM 42143]